MDENDWAGWQPVNLHARRKCQLVGDDLFVTNVEFLKKGIEKAAPILFWIKVNRIGTLSETLDAIEMAHRNGYTSVLRIVRVRLRDATIADIAVATNSGQIKPVLEPFRPYGEIQPVAPYRRGIGCLGCLWV